MSKKNIFGIASGLIIIVLGFLPYYMGIQLEKSLQEYIDVQPYSEIYKYEISNYDRGWFSSSADFQMTIDFSTLNTELADFEKQTITSFMTASHGPIIISDRGLSVGIGDFSADVTFNINEIFKHISPETPQINSLNIFSIMEFNLDGSFDLIIPAFSYEVFSDNSSGIMTFDSGDSYSYVDYDPETDKFSYISAWDSFAFIMEDKDGVTILDINTRNIEFDYDVKFLPKLVMVGKTNSTAEEMYFTITTKTGTISITINGMVNEHNSILNQNNTVDSVSKMITDKVAISAQSFGLDFDYGPIIAQVNTSNIDELTMSEISFNSENTEVVEDLVRKLLQHDPMIELVSLVINTEKGNAEMTSILGFTYSEDMDMENKEELVAATDFSLDAIVASDLVETILRFGVSQQMKIDDMNSDEVTELVSATIQQLRATGMLDFDEETSSYVYGLVMLDGVIYYNNMPVLDVNQLNQQGMVAN